MTEPGAAWRLRHLLPVAQAGIWSRDPDDWAKRRDPLFMFIPYSCSVLPATQHWSSGRAASRVYQRYTHLPHPNRAHEQVEEPAWTHFKTAMRDMLPCLECLPLLDTEGVARVAAAWLQHGEAECCIFSMDHMREEVRSWDHSPISDLTLGTIQQLLASSLVCDFC